MRASRVYVLPLAFDRHLGRFPAADHLRHVVAEFRFFAKDHSDQAVQRPLDGVEEDRAAAPDLEVASILGRFNRQVSGALVAKMKRAGAQVAHNGPRALHRFVGSVAKVGSGFEVFGHGEKVTERRDLFLAGR